jgi:hypothetical protein
LTVRVGPEDCQQDFLLHEGIICARSEFFHRAMNGNWAEKTKRLVELPADEPKTVALYVSLVYTGAISSSTDDHETTPDEFQAHILAIVKLYILAEKLRDKTAKNAALKTIHNDIAAEFTANKLPNAEIIQLMYENTLKGSLGRRLMVDLWNDVTTKYILEQYQGICKEFFVDLAYALHDGRRQSWNSALHNRYSTYLEEV